jgi:putative membrane protein
MPPETVAATPWYSWLPHVNAALNALATVLIVAGLIAIKRRNERLHVQLLLAAFGVSAAFLASYLTYHLSAPPVKFTKEGAIRGVYFAILISHIVLAAVQVPLILNTIRLGLRDDRPRHRKWAKITAPIWLYVSVTGVVVYMMLYRM